METISQLSEEEMIAQERGIFQSRANAFYDDYRDGEGFEDLQIHGTTLHVGTNENSGLVIGKADLPLLHEVMGLLKRLYENEQIIPQTYSLIELNSCHVDRNVMVQEFVDRPNLDNLINYLMGQSDSTYLDLLSERSIGLCQEFLNRDENQGVDVGLLRSVSQELYEHSTSLAKYGRRTIFADRNVLAMEKEPSGKLVIAPVDVE